MVGSNPPMPRRFRFTALLALLLAAAGMSACGGGDGGSNRSADELLKATFGQDANVRSGRLSASLVFDPKGLQNIRGPITLKVTGPFESRGKGKVPELDLDVALSGAGANFTAGAVSTGEKAWVELQGNSYLVDDATFQEFRKGYEASAGRSNGGGPSFRSLGIEPLRWLRDPRIAGEETVGGAPTQRITASVDIAAFLEDVSTLLGRAGQLGGAAGRVPSSLTERQRRDIAASVKDAGLDVWTGTEDTTLRRLRLAIAIAVPEAVRGRAGGLQTGRLAFDLTIADLNQPQEVAGPKNARPLEDLRALLGAGAGGAQAPGRGGASPAPAPGGASAAPAPGGASAAPGQGGAGSSAYLECVSAAGGDVAKVQRCARLAGG